jgi:hypothetical protein
VAVRRGSLDDAGADGAGGTGLVVDNEALAELLLQLRRQRTGQRVGGAAWRERHDDGDRLVGPCVRGGGKGDAEGDRGEQALHAGVSW